MPENIPNIPDPITPIGDGLGSRVITDPLAALVHRGSQALFGPNTAKLIGDMAVTGARAVAPLASSIEGAPLQSDVSRQFIAGILDTPGAVPGLAGLLALGVEAATGTEPGLSKPLLDASRYVFDKASRAAGVDVPNTPGQALARVAGGLAIPGPKLPRVGNFAGRTALNIAEISSPVVFGMTPGRLAANIAAGFTLDQTIRGLLDPRDPAYVFADKEGEKLEAGTEAMRAPALQPFDVPIPEGAVLDQQPGDGIRTIGYDVEIPEGAILGVPGPVTQEEGLGFWPYAIGGAALALGSGALLKHIRRPASRRGVVNPNEIGAAKLGEDALGNKPRTVVSATTPREIAGTRSVNPVFNVQSILARTGLPDAVQKATDWASRVTQFTRSGGLTSTATFLHTGELPGVAGKVRPLVELQEILGKLTRKRVDPSDPLATFGKNEQEVLSNYLVALDALDNAKRATAAIRGRVKNLQSGIAKLKAKRQTKTVQADIAKLEERLGLVEAAFKPGTRRSAPSFTQFVESGEARRLVKLVEQTRPDYVRFSRQLQENFEHTLTLAREQGLISAKLFREVRAKHPHFIPNISAEGVRSFRDYIDELAKTTEHVAEQGVVDAVRQMLRRTQMHGGGVQQGLNPLQSAEQAMIGLIHSARQNALRREALQDMAQAVDQSIAGSVKKVKVKNNKKLRDAVARGEGIITLAGGRQEGWLVADPSIVAALKFAPHRSHNTLFNMTRQVFQQSVTGIGAPTFALKSFVWSSVYNPIMREKGFVGGPIEKYLRLGTGGRLRDFTRGVDSGLLAPVSLASNLFGRGGVVSQLKSSVQGRLARSIITSLESQTGVWSVFPRPAMERLGQTLAKWHMESPRVFLERFGAFNTSMNNDAIQSGFSLLERHTPNFTNKWGPIPGRIIFDAYRGLLEAMFHAPKTRFFVLNYKEGMSPQQVNKLLHATRAIEGDFPRKGLGNVNAIPRPARSDFERAQGVLAQKFSKYVTSQNIGEKVPYANVAVQAMTRMGVMFKRSPHGFLTGLFNGVALPALAGVVLVEHMGAEYRDYYWNRMPGWKRVSGAYLPLPGVPPEEGIYVPFPPEVTMFLGGFIHGMDQLMGYSNSANRENLVLSDLTDALAQVVGLGLPPLVNAGLAGAGLTLDPSRMIRGLQGGFETRTISPQLSGETGRNVKRIDAALSAKMEDVVTSLFGTAARNMIDLYEGAMGEDGTFDLAGGTQQLGMTLAQRRALLAPLTGVYKEYMLNYSKVQLGSKLHAADRVVDVYERMFLGGANSRNFSIALGGKLPRSPTNPTFLNAAPAARVFFALNPVLSELKEQRNALRNQIVTHDSVRPVTRDVLQQLNALKVQEKRISEMMLDEVERFEQHMGVKIEDLDPFAK